jgi:S1-C subfamily serine protease
MLGKSRLLFIIFFSLLFSCTTINLERKVTPPLKSYVKIYHNITIEKCTEPFEKVPGLCPKGQYGSMGSGMIFDLIEDQTIVITAGHVCESLVDEEKIASYSEGVHVVDFRGRSHQAHVIKASHDNKMGSVDMCALWVPTLKEKGVKFSMFRPKPGQELYYVGSPEGIYHPPVAPIMLGIYSGQIDASNAMVSIPATGGSSGSAVMDMNNRVVGILWAAHSFHHVSIMTNWDASALFLYEVSKMYTGKSKSKLNLGPIKN